MSITDNELPHFGGRLMSTQVSALLMRELKSGSYAEAEKLPAELELAERLGVSRTVIRDALSDIEREGFIERVRGVGTVINRSVVDLPSRLDLKLEYNELIQSMGYHPFTDSLQLRLERADEGLADQLHMDVGAELIVCEKRILAGSTPCIYSVDYLARELFSGIPFEDVDWAMPVFDLLDRYCGLSVVTETAHVTAVIGDERVRRLLAVPPTSALLLLDEVGYTKMFHPVLRSLEYYTEFFDFTMLRKKF